MAQKERGFLAGIPGPARDGFGLARFSFQRYPFFIRFPERGILTMEADAAGRIRMFLKRRTFNPKRRLYPEEGLRPRQQILSLAIDGVRYSGNPEHKRNPGDFGLNPPSSPRAGKTLCDTIGIHKRDEAEALLREGLLRGTFSAQEREGWPQNVLWAVTAAGDALEAQLEGNGVYHGYPMAESDPFQEKVFEQCGGR